MVNNTLRDPEQELKFPWLGETSTALILSHPSPLPRLFGSLGPTGTLPVRKQYIQCIIVIVDPPSLTPGRRSLIRLQRWLVIRQVWEHMAESFLLLLSACTEDFLLAGCERCRFFFCRSRLLPDCLDKNLLS